MDSTKLIIIITAIFGFTFFSVAQNAEYYRVKKNTGKVILTPYDNSSIIMYQLSGLFDNAKKIIYNDTVNGYIAEIPKKMEIQETNSLYNFCFTIPKNNQRDNAICINSAPKSSFENISRFKEYFVEDNKYLGENSENWIWGENSRLISFSKEKFNNHDGYNLNILMNDRDLLGKFIFIETKKSYLCINLVGDKNTFNYDVKELSKFLKKFKLL